MQHKRVRNSRRVREFPDVACPTARDAPGSGSRIPARNCGNVCSTEQNGQEQELPAVKQNTRMVPAIKLCDARE